MELFTRTIDEVRSFLAGKNGKSRPASSSVPWPDGGGRNIVFKDDLGLELGSPEKESVSCLLWTGDLSRIEDGRVTLVGPDFPESAGQSLPFGKVVLAGVEDFDEDNAYDLHKELDFLRYDLNLKGFMMRAVSQYLREWCRISREALREGFSAHILGSELVRLFKTKPYVKAAEVIFITSSTEDICGLREITAPAERIIAAMNKMASEMDFECSSCDYREVCDDASQLKAMRDRLKEKSREGANA